LLSGQTFDFAVNGNFSIHRIYTPWQGWFSHVKHNSTTIWENFKLGFGQGFENILAFFVANRDLNSDRTYQIRMNQVYH
jgi:hypothetical protein